MPFDWSIDFPLEAHPFNHLLPMGPSSHNAFESGLEPLDSIIFGHLMLFANLALAPSSPCNTCSRPAPTTTRQPWRSTSISKPNSHAAIKVHPVDPNGRVILDTEIDVFRDTKTKVASIGEVLLPQLVFLDLQPSLENLFGFGTSDGDVDGNLFVSADTE